MNISGIGSYTGFYDYNSIKSSTIPEQIQTVPAVEPDAKGFQQQKEPQVQETSGEFRNQRDNAFEYASVYQPAATYQMKGADSDIQSLDISRAISDMQKDQVLQQYQFFVGESKAQSDMLATNTQNGSSNTIENFSL